MSRPSYLPSTRPVTLLPLRARREELVKTLDDAPPDQIATVDEQRAFANAWRAELGKQ